MKSIIRALPLVVGLLLVGCGGDKAETGSQAEGASGKVSSQQGDNRQSHGDSYVSPLPADAPVYTVTMTGSTPPFSYQDDYGVMSGIDVDVIRAVGESQGFKVDIKKAPSWSAMFKAVETGKTDLAMSGISYRDERAKKYSLSEPYIFNPASLAYNSSDKPIKSVNDLAGKKVGVIAGTTALATKFFNGVPNVTVVEENTPFLVYQMLIRDKVDAIIYDQPVWAHYGVQIPEYKMNLFLLQGKDVAGAHAVVLANKDKAELIESVSTGITELKANGKIEEIEKKWLTSE